VPAERGQHLFAISNDGAAATCIGRIILGIDEKLGYAGMAAVSE
jgi:hypothetical protein